MKLFAIGLLIVGTGITITLAGELPAAIKLPVPQLEQGCSVMQALKNRQSRRELRAEKLPVQELANLLWAAWWINRRWPQK